MLYFIQMMSLTPTVCCHNLFFSQMVAFFWGESGLPLLGIIVILQIPAQKAFADLLHGLFHWELDTTDQRAYSLAPADCPGLPLFSFAGETSYFNHVFWLVYDDATTWLTWEVVVL
jgi:hypothetical protein